MQTFIFGVIGWS